MPGLPYLYCILITAASSLPRALSYWVARRVGELAYVLHWRARLALKSNIRVVIGAGANEHRVRRAARQAFRLYGMFIVDLFGFGGLRREILATIREDNAAAFARAWSAGGVVICSAHFGSWDLIPAFLAHRRISALCIVAESPDPIVAGVFRRLRRTLSQKIVPVGRAMRRCVKALQCGQWAVIALGDRPFGERGVPLELFGRRILFPQGLARIALHARVPLLPAFVRREADGYVILWGTPILPPSDLRRRDAVAIMLRAYAAQLAAVVRRHPEQWFIFHTLFDPDGQTPDPLRRRLEKGADLRLVPARQPTGRPLP